MGQYVDWSDKAERRQGWVLEADWIGKGGGVGEEE